MKMVLIAVLIMSGFVNVGTTLAVELEASVRSGYFRIEVDGEFLPEKFTTYRKAIYAHQKAVKNNPSAAIKLIPDWFETIKVTGTSIEPLDEVTLSWTAPTENTDDSPLTDLVGFKVYYGASMSDLSTVIDTTETQLKIQNLASNTYYFAVTAVNSLGVESEISNIVNKIVM